MLEEATGGAVPGRDQHRGGLPERRDRRTDHPAHDHSWWRDPARDVPNVLEVRRVDPWTSERSMRTCSTSWWTENLCSLPVLRPLSRHGGHPEVNVDEALRVLCSIWRIVSSFAQGRWSQTGPSVPLSRPTTSGRSGMYGRWLPQATASEVAVDEIGLWYQITERGRQAWSQSSGSSGDDRDRWMLDDRADQGILEVRAGRNDVAEAALDKWLAEHGEVQEIPGTRESVKIPEFVMRDGTRVPDGVLVTCRYRVEKR